MDILGHSYLSGWAARVAGARGCCDSDAWTVFDIYRHLRLDGTSDDVNSCLIEWSLGRRALWLLYRVPSVAEVLEMQAHGFRPVTCFVSKTGIEEVHTGTLHYMSGSKEHSRDALEFCVHDLRHAQHFCENDCVYRQQVGFFRCVSRLGGPGGFLDRILSPSMVYDETFWHELAYVLADMNTHAAHLINYLKVKWKKAHTRAGYENFDELWARCTRLMGFQKDSAAVIAADALCSRPLEESEWSALRSFFRDSAHCNVDGRDFDLPVGCIVQS